MIMEYIKNLISKEIKFNYLWESIVPKIRTGFTIRMGKNMIKEVMKWEKMKKEQPNSLTKMVLK